MYLDLTVEKYYNKYQLCTNDFFFKKVSYDENKFICFWSATNNSNMPVEINQIMWLCPLWTMKHMVNKWTTSEVIVIQYIYISIYGPDF